MAEQTQTFVRGISASGEVIELMQDKTATIMKIPEYIQSNSLDDPKKEIEKLKMSVKLSDGSIVDYYPNKTSIRTLSALYGMILENWVGKKFEWRVAEMPVRGETKKVLFVLEKRLRANGSHKH